MSLIPLIYRRKNKGPNTAICCRIQQVILEEWETCLCMLFDCVTQKFCFVRSDLRWGNE